jgi:hypothetical protein
MLLAAVLVAAGLIASAPAPASAKTGGARLVELINKERTSRGLSKLVTLSRLNAMALAHSKNMGADGAACGTPALHHNPKLDQQIQPSTAWAENVACGGDVDQMHVNLMNSPGHRANILNPAYNAVGAGTFTGSTLWGTENFAKVSKAELEDAGGTAATAPRPVAQAPRRPRAEPAPAPEPEAEPVVAPEPKPRPVPVRTEVDLISLWPALRAVIDRFFDLPELLGTASG